MPRRVIAFALVFALAAPSVAGAHWAAPVSPTGDVAPGVFRPQVAFSGAGDRVVAYGAGGRLAWAWAPGGGDAPFTSMTTTTTDVSARLLTYAIRRVMVISRTSGRAPSELRVRFGSVDGDPGPVRRLAPGEDVLRYAPAVDARGDAVVAYVHNVRRGPVVRRRVVRVLRRPAGGSFARPVTVAGRAQPREGGGPRHHAVRSARDAPAGVANPTTVGAAVGPRGEIVVAYERGGRLEVRRRAPGASWTAPQVLGPAVEGHTQIDVAAGGDGGLAVGWFVQELTEGGDNGPAAVRLAVRDAGGHAFHAARTLETFAERAPDGAGVHVAVGADGSGVAGWTGRQGDRFVARAADVRSRVGQTISDPSGDAVLGGVAVGPGGAAVAVWVPPLDTPSPQVFAAVRPAAGQAFAGPETVSPPYREIASPTVGVDPRTGAALAAWVARTGDRTQAIVVASRADRGR